MEPIWAKVVSLCVIGVFTLVSGILPLRFSSTSVGGGKSSRGKLLNVLLAFSGGVLFATCFIHLIPEVHEGFEKSNYLQIGGNRTIVYSTGAESRSQPDPGSSTEPILPWGELTVCIGFFIIFAIEEIVEHLVCRSCEENHHHHNEIKDPGGSGSCVAPVHSIHGAHRDPHDLRDCDKVQLQTVDIIQDDRRNLSDDRDCDLGPCPETCDDKEPLWAPGKSSSVYGSCNDQKMSISYSSPEEGPAHVTKADALDPVSALDTQSLLGVLRGLVLVCALSFHSLFEGMAIGLQSTSNDVWNTFLGVAIHKFVVVFCVGVELVNLQTKPKVFVLYIFALTLMSTVGIAIGIVFTEVNLGMDQHPLVLASLQGLATGTLLYVTVFEVLAKTKDVELPFFLNFVAILTGFASMTAFHLLE